MANETFKKKAPQIMNDLMKDFHLTDFQAAAILGNIGVECNGFKTMHEIGQSDGKGGYGWCQWTNTRRVEFEKFVHQHGFNKDSYDANYGFLKHELETTQNPALAALRKTNNQNEAVEAFEKHFEKAKSGKEHFDRREEYANTALAAFHEDKHSATALA
jgi:hypothetical protein